MSEFTGKDGKYWPDNMYESAWARVLLASGTGGSKLSVNAKTLWQKAGGGVRCVKEGKEDADEDGRPYSSERWIYPASKPGFFNVFYGEGPFNKSESGTVGTCVVFDEDLCSFVSPSSTYHVADKDNFLRYFGEAAKITAPEEDAQARFRFAFEKGREAGWEAGRKVGWWNGWNDGLEDAGDASKLASRHAMVFAGKGDETTIASLQREDTQEHILSCGLALTNYCHGVASECGWWSSTTERDVPRLLMLCVSELAEAMEGHRKDLMDTHLSDRKMLEVELADTLIRIFDMAGGLGLDVAGALRDKLIYNTTREDHKPEVRAAGGKAY